MRFEIRELGAGGVLDQGIDLVKSHLGLLIGIVLVLQVPALLLAGLLFTPVPPDPELLNAPETAPLFWEQYTQMMTQSAFVAIPSLLIVWPLTNAAVMHALASLYLRRPISIGGAYRRAFRVWLPTLWTGFLWNCSMLGGFMLCLIPGILCWLWFALVFQIVVVEGSSGFAAMARSRRLMKGALGDYVVLVVLLFTIAVALGMVSGLIPQQLIRTTVNALIQSALFVFASAAYVVFYFSCRCRHENFDLEMLARAVAEPGPESQHSQPAIDERPAI